MIALPFNYQLIITAGKEDCYYCTRQVGAISVPYLASKDYEGIARRIPLLKVGHDIQLDATAMAANMAVKVITILPI